MSVAIAAPSRPKIRPAFVVRELKGTRPQQVTTFGKEGNRITKTIDVPRGYMVQFPNGNSIAVDKDELRRLGFDRTIPLINDEGEAVGELPNTLSQFVDDDVGTEGDAR